MLRELTLMQRLRLGLVLLSALALALSPSAARNPARVLRYDSALGLQAASASATSRNWAGYILPVAGVTDVEGTWTVPAVPVTADDRASGTWIGIGGAASDDLIQAGTAQNSVGGRTQYLLWYEMLPDPAYRLPIQVTPGDRVHVSIQETDADVWLIHAQDLSTGQLTARSVRYHSSLSSADWIEEAPSNLSGEVQTLANFGSVHFTDAAALAGGQPLDLSGAVGVSMGDGPVSLASVNPTASNSFDAIVAAPH
jgi:hypothetical protein